jgi:hypothetical protein
LPLWYDTHMNNKLMEGISRVGASMRVLAGESEGEGETLLTVDSRKRISLGKLARHDHYQVSEEPGGALILTPVVVVPINHPALREYLAAKADKK